MSKETTGLDRSGFWGAMISLVVIQARTAAAAADSAGDDGTIIVFVVIAVLVLRWIVVYMRKKNIGWHGAHTLWALVPFVWIYFGRVPTGHSNRKLNEVPGNVEAT